MTKDFNILFLLISIGWAAFSTCLIILFAASKLGPTPLFLPLILAGVSLAGVVIGLLLACFKKIKILPAATSIVFLGISIAVQLKAFAEILYVS